MLEILKALSKSLPSPEPPACTAALLGFLFRSCLKGSLLLPGGALGQACLLSPSTNRVYYGYRRVAPAYLCGISGSFGARFAACSDKQSVGPREVARAMER